MLKIIPEGEQTFEQTQVKRVWSLVYKNDSAYAVYYAEWPLQSDTDFEVRIHIVFGRWGEGILPTDRHLVAVLYRALPKPGFMVTDADNRTTDYQALSTRILTRDEVLADAVMKESVFELLDQVWVQDTRIKWQ